ncbi:hypothetical protein [Maribacter sp.]|uniref:hypothetical protein n=1 Tax=Maribacter sp. TaxID=1897614 RepID=UPI0025C4FB04|nr:hypothetical protein [Maribacter sp.]
MTKIRYLQSYINRYDSGLFYKISVVIYSVNIRCYRNKKNRVSKVEVPQEAFMVVLKLNDIYSFI